MDGEPCTSNCGHNISTVLLDDLLEVIPFKTAIMKIDIQAHEHKAFAHAEKLLDTVSIPYIFMEFQEMKTLYISSNHISKDKRMIANMIAMLQRRGYKPRSGIRSRVLNPNTWQYWPNDMVWVRDWYRVALIILVSALAVFTNRQQSCGKVMFSQASVCSQEWQGIPGPSSLSSPWFHVLSGGRGSKW